MQQVLPDDDNTSGVFCVIPNCDPKYKVLLDATFGLQNKRTHGEAFQNKTATTTPGVPTYYTQKTLTTTAGTGPATANGQKRRKFGDGNTG